MESVFFFEIQKYFASLDHNNAWFIIFCELIGPSNELDN